MSTSDQSSFIFATPKDGEVKSAFKTLREASRNAKEVDKDAFVSMSADFKVFIEFLERNMNGLSPEDRLTYIEKAERAYYENANQQKKVHEKSHETQQGTMVIVGKYIFAAAALLSAGAAAAAVAYLNEK